MTLLYCYNLKLNLTTETRVFLRLEFLVLKLQTRALNHLLQLVAHKSSVPFCTHCKECLRLVYAPADKLHSSKNNKSSQAKFGYAETKLEMQKEKNMNSKIEIRQPYVTPLLKIHTDWKVMTAVQSVPITNFVPDINPLERLMNNLEGE